MNAKWKRNAVVATMMVLVGSAVLLNWKYSGQNAIETVEETGTKILGEATLVSGQEQRQTRHRIRMMHMHDIVILPDTPHRHDHTRRKHRSLDLRPSPGTYQLRILVMHIHTHIILITRSTKHVTMNPLSRKTCHQIIHDLLDASSYGVKFT
jgi:stage III sporulation protein AH